MKKEVKHSWINETRKTMESTNRIGVPIAIESHIQRNFSPDLEIRFNNKKKIFELYEWFTDKAQKCCRLLWVYENPDGTRFPVVQHVMEKFLREADTRVWPMEDRVKLYVKQQLEAEKRSDNEVSDIVSQIAMDDYTRIAGIPTFFMDPKSMPERIAKPAPYQARAEKSLLSSGGK